ncbi:MAG: prepilin-type N-terminal cleavage/methylation domain-containing protein [Candidatus Riflebacteria bacterium]|nr:prepilin-type N-terminal cleavage/methylation domain-containing protein [Candidatus Riflebacteria bacterium]
MRHKAAFTLIELLVVITIIAILVGAALPYVQGYVAESRISKAKSDLDEIKNALAIYETREGSYNAKDVSLLTGRYLNSSPIDPWGKPFVVATGTGIVFSSGPDRIDYTSDDIVSNYQPPLALVSVKWVDANQSGAVDTQNTRDYLQLYFSRKIASNSVAITPPVAAPDTYFGWSSPNSIATSMAWNEISLDSSGNLVTISFATSAIDVFAPGSDTFWINSGTGIRDLASGTGNMCIASQPMLIFSAR